LKDLTNFYLVILGEAKNRKVSRTQELLMRVLMESPRPAVITAIWVSINLLPLLLAAFLWLVLGHWLAGLLLVILYPLYIVFYGFFVALPVMVRLFRLPATSHQQ
jgi:hypothetical protein